jgi:hypothetical protein
VLQIYHGDGAVELRAEDGSDGGAYDKGNSTGQPDVQKHGMLLVARWKCRYLSFARQNWISGATA